MAEVCGGCGEGAYCTAAHQKLHWREHKRECAGFKAEAEAGMAKAKAEAEEKKRIRDEKKRIRDAEERQKAADISTAEDKLSHLTWHMADAWEVDHR